MKEKKRCWHDFPLGHKPNLNVDEKEKKGKITKYWKRNMKERNFEFNHYNSSKI